MLFPYSWLREYLSNDDLVKGKWTADKIGRKLALTMTEYEGREEVMFDLAGVVVGKILNIYPHQESNKLSIADVDVGKKKVRIVCGAPNLFKGMLVPVALPGTKLQGDVMIEEIEICGVRSGGMICAASELGLEEESRGALDLGKNMKVGEKLSRAVDFNDEVLDLAITPNMVYADNMIGMAKEIAVACAVRFVGLKNKLVENSQEKIDDMLEVQIKEGKKCRRYSARVMKNIKVVDSPLWLKRRLQMAGMRPINSVVDITNYVMLEMGQPMHAFDYDLVIGEKIIVRNAKDGEGIETLDGQRKVLTKNDLVIADEKRPLAIAGIIGGMDSRVAEKTSRIILESANFGREYINVSAKNLGLQTDSSIRYGRGISASKTIEALDRAAYLIQQICGGEVVRGSIDVRSERILKREVKAEYDRINSLLGTEVAKNEVNNILKSLGFEVKKSDEKQVVVIVPPDREDVDQEADLIEEIGRIHGYEKINEQVFAMPVVVPKPEGQRRYRNKIISYLLANGWSEVYNYSFVSAKQTTGWGWEIENAYELDNPIDQKSPYLRQSLVAGLMDKLIRWSADSDEVKIFEWGKVFNSRGKRSEVAKVGVVLARKDEPKFIFQEMKNYLAGVFRLGGLDLDGVKWCRAKDAADQLDWLHPVNSMVWYGGDKKKLGEFGLLHPAVANEWKLNNNIVYAELDLERLTNEFDEKFKFQPISKYPVSQYDIAVVVDKDLMSRELMNEGRKTGGSLLKKVTIFDEYDMGEKKSVGLRFEWRAMDRTLSDEEVEGLMDKVVAGLNKKFGAELRKQ